MLSDSTLLFVCICAMVETSPRTEPLNTCVRFSRGVFLAGGDYQLTGDWSMSRAIGGGPCVV